MSYLTQALVADDATIQRRVTACAATEGVTDPAFWVQEHRWQLSAQPGWVDAYKYALDSGDDHPGANEASITDGMILAAVQSLLGIEVPDPEPEVPEPDVPEDPEEPEPEPEPDPEPEEEPDSPEEPESEPAPEPTQEEPEDHNPAD